MIRPPAEPSVTPNRTRTRTRIGIVLAGLVVLALAGMWAYVFLIGPEEDLSLEDPAWAERAAATCAATRDRIDQLPRADTATSPQQRAEWVGQSTDWLAEMVETLRADSPSTIGDRDIIGRWLADWDVYLADRRLHVEALQRGEDPRFSVTETDQGPINRRMNYLADQLEMRRCSTPTDV